MNPYCVILWPEPLVNPVSYARTKRFFLRAPSAGGADVAFKLIRRCSCLTHLCLNILFDKAPDVQCWSPTWPQLRRILPLN
jgi:hypothetical protein